MRIRIKTLFLVFCIGIIPISKPVHAGEKVVLIELFTNSGCIPCRPANEYFNSWLSTYEKKDRVAVVKYYVWWPWPSDPFYNSTADLIRVRKYHYDFYGVPWAFIDGFLDGGFSYSTWQSLIENRLNSPSPFDISVTGITSGNANDIEVTITPTGDAIPAGTLRLHIIIVETHINFTGPNGDPVHHYVMRDMITGAQGETFTISLHEAKNFEKSFDWNSDWNFENGRIVFFVQLVESNEVLQSSMIPVDDISEPTPAYAGEIDIPSSYLLYQNYPNPFNPSTVIRYGLPQRSSVKLEVYNVMGQQVTTLVNGDFEAGYYEVEWHSGPAASGLYFYRIESVSHESTSNRHVEMKSMILIK
jgi:hypothetical protein